MLDEAAWVRHSTRVLELKKPSFLVCYEREVRRVELNAVAGLYRTQNPPSMAGRVVVVLPVERDGRVRAPRLEEDTLGNETVGDCLLDVARAIVFEPIADGQTTELSLPLSFKLSGPQEAPR